MGVWVGVTVGVPVGVPVGVLVGSGVPNDTTTSRFELPVRFHAERMTDELFAAELDEREVGLPVVLTSAPEDHVV